MAKTKPAADGVVVRLLLDHPVDGITYPGNTPLRCAPALADSLVGAGVADANEAAVAYVIGELGLAIVDHQPPAAADPAADPATAGA